MFSRSKFILLLAVCMPVFFVSCDKDEEDPYDVVVDFEDVTFPSGQEYVNDLEYSKNIVSFQNSQGSTWYGFAFSQMNDMQTPGLDNEYSVYALDNSDGNKFAVGFISSWDSDTIEISFSQPIKDLSFDVANTTYAALAMKDGDDWATKFTDTDLFKLSITAINSEGYQTATLNLGEGTKITNAWNTIRFTISGITKLKFSLSSTDVFIYEGDSYMNTPAYFCLDNLKARTLK